LRHLKYLYEVLGQEWAGEMACLLLRIKKHVDLCKLFGSEDLPIDDISEYERMYHAILSKAALSLEMTDPYTPTVDEEGAANAGVAPKKRKKKTESERMVTRLAEYEQETLLFMYDFSVPFDNNLSEQSIRMPKLRQKISGCFRTTNGAKMFARIRSFVATTKKKGKNIYDGIKAALQGDGSEFLYPEKS
jgi:transposase